MAELPATVGAVTVDQLTARGVGPRRFASATLRVYTNRPCAGAAAVRVRLVGGKANVRFPHGWALPSGSVFSILGSRRLTVELRVAGHPRRPRTLEPRLPAGP